MLVRNGLIVLSIVRAGIVTSIQGDETGQCSVYLFSSSNPDKLTFDSPFTGNLKVLLAGSSEQGLSPAVVAGRHGAFILSVDPVNEPNWVQYEVAAAALSEIVSATFNGVVGLIGINDVFYKINMGPKPDEPAGEFTPYFTSGYINQGYIE